MENQKKFLDRLTDFLGDSEGMTTEEVKAELREEGVDIDGMLKRMSSLRHNAMLTSAEKKHE